MNGKTAALILAAGRSSRMGESKALLPLGGETAIEQLIGVFREAGVGDILVVVGHESHRLIPLLVERDVRWVENDRYDDGMFSSVQVGVSYLREDGGAFFVHPVDIPLIRAETLRTLQEVFQEGKGDICRPCFQGRRGHPPLLASTLIPHIIAFTEAGGLRVFLSRHAWRSQDVECADAGILAGMNTPEEYQALGRRHGAAGDVPDAR